MRQERDSDPLLGEGAVPERLAPVRVTWRALAAEALDRAITAASRVSDGCTRRAVARRLGVSHTSVERWCDPASGRVAKAGDIDAMGARVAVSWHTAMIGEHIARDAATGRATATAQSTVHACVIRLGAATAALERDLADGREDEHAAHADALEAIAREALLGATAARARAKGGR